MSAVLTIPLYIETVVITKEPPKQDNIGTAPNVRTKPLTAGLPGIRHGGTVQTLLFPFPNVRASRYSRGLTRTRKNRANSIHRMIPPIPPFSTVTDSLPYEESNSY